jgi:F0F1-type ATP synthase assembly protein I
LDLNARRELNNGFGNSLARAFELVLSPVVFGFFGWLLDGRLGTRPLFMLLLFAFTAGYLFWKQFSNYDAAMKKHEQALFAPKREVEP